jgi:ribonucleoside-diphosphate reductase alpha chain
MTETVSGTARKSAKKGATVPTQSSSTPKPAAKAPVESSSADRGLRIERVYTTAGVHPYDAVTWESRDVVMTNWRDGSVNFEQYGVEFPDFWSVNAANIVTTKYFRGAVGTPQRETSLRQVIDRVVQTYRKAGQEHGYFATDEDAEIFEHELTHMLVHQVFSFNSPVWFNVGTASPQQVSACFILSVDDTMDSILNWYREEGLIFKGGSGAGLNLSRIRSSKELLSSGGNASGPVSFMRGADASAGTIKSGGATRRAAKMVVLDVDHPDVAGVHPDQGARRGQDPRAARRRVRHGPRRRGHHLRAVPEREQLGPGQRRVHARRTSRAPSSAWSPAPPAR